MKICLVLSVLFALVCMNWAAVAHIPNTKHKDYPNQCYIESENKAYTFGIHYPAKKCIELLCNQNYSVQIHTCGRVFTEEGYHNEIDYNKPYPDCCVNIVKDTQ